MWETFLFLPIYRFAAVPPLGILGIMNIGFWQEIAKACPYYAKGLEVKVVWDDLRQILFLQYKPSINKLN